MSKIDSIVCDALTSQGLPVHCYLKFLNYAISCLRELNMDVMRNVKTVKLQLNSYSAVKVPCNFLDWTKIGIPAGQYVVELSQKESLNRLRNFDNNGTPIPYPSVTNDYDLLRSKENSYYAGGYLNIINDWGENKGGFFSWGNGDNRMSFKFIKERNEIQMNANFFCNHIVLEYISDGLDDCGCDTLVNPYAYNTIKTYAIWQYFLNSKQLMRMAPEWERHYNNELRILRARMSPITKADILTVLRKNYKATIKN